jgi:serine/threonine protein kinase
MIYNFLICMDHLSLGCAGVGRYKNQNVAIKIVHKGDTPEEVVKRQGRFLREVTMLSRVQHKNLVKVCFFLTIVIHSLYCKCWVLLDIQNYILLLLSLLGLA